MTLNGESYENSLEEALPFMKHFHISEPFLEKIGDGKTDHNTLGRILNRIDYNGWISIEMKSGLGNNDIDTIDKCLGFVKQNYFTPTMQKSGMP